MFVKLFLLFVALPLIELALLLVVGKYIGVLPTLLLVIVTGVGGAWLAQRQGTHALSRIRRDFAAGNMPTDAVTDALLIFVAGLLLLSPGVLSDLMGIVLLVPAGRSLAKYWLFRWLKLQLQIPTLRPRPSEAPAGGEVIDSYTVSSNPREDVA